MNQSNEKCIKQNGAEKESHCKIFKKEKNYIARLLSHFSCVQLFATLWTVCSPPGSSVHGILQTTGVGCPALLQGIFPPPRDQAHVS